jgi:hypothetical protein
MAFFLFLKNVISHFVLSLEGNEWDTSFLVWHLTVFQSLEPAEKMQFNFWGEKKREDGGR